ncbi:glycosyltransferase family 4 protein [Flavobacterium pectinovorum]|uniref:glycosyltransferase family 4 protein n=1 Tax=Flavobacterium pectinovorum TaxID=29533 RepID=UPI001FAD7354|nr:glycosyltransferase family 4 protein [Flavobacterium pectinovorum]MCI9843887.1 glycosyltransferase family 4 protein [Flavobacterium pectinovorum]
MEKVILISQFPLPYSKIGSWTTMYYNYLKNNHQIDCVICHKPERHFDTVKYQLVSENIVDKIKRKFFKKTYTGYLKALRRVVKPNEKYIIQIVDNFGIIKPLQKFLIKNGLRGNCQIQFFYHGFPPFLENFHGRWFFESIDEMILLTHDSYKVHKDCYTILPCKFSILHNGIDTEKFHKISLEEKLRFKNELDLKDKKVFIWCSKDLPKKGLDFILEVWKKIHLQNKDTALLVVGATRNIQIEGVHFLGKISNNELPKYYQMSDCYLFPTLWHEGFGMSLIEAMHSGCYCIASAIGGVPEVLQYGKLGRLIENSHFQQEWEDAVLEFLNQKEIKETVIPDNLYSTQSWNSGMNKIIENAKDRLK